MDLVLKGRGIRLTEQIHRTAQHKLAKIERIDPRVRRIEVEIIGDLKPRVGASHRVEVACDRGRRSFRAEGTGLDLDSALDQAVQRLEGQITRYRGKLRNRLIRRFYRLQSAGTSPEESSPSA